MRCICGGEARSDASFRYQYQSHGITVGGEMKMAFCGCPVCEAELLVKVLGQMISQHEAEFCYDEVS
jgi:hypothetical protein